MEYYAINTDTSLYHFGVTGMKWGIRRYEGDYEYSWRGTEYKRRK